MGQVRNVEDKIERFIGRYVKDNSGDYPDEINVTVSEYRAIRASVDSDGGISPRTGSHCLMFWGIPIKVKPYSDLDQDWDVEAEQDEAWEEFNERKDHIK